MRMIRELIISLIAFLTLIPYVTSGEDFSKAMAIASTNAPAGADVAGMGNAWVAAPDFSSNNPAIIAASKDFKFAATGNYGFINFDKGPRILFYSLTPTIKVPIGIFRFSFSYAHSGNSATELGSDMELNSNLSINIAYGVKIGRGLLLKEDELSAGVDLSPCSRSKLSFSARHQDLLTSQTKSFAMGAGLLYKPLRQVSIGIYYNHAEDTNHDRDLVAGVALDTTSKNDQFRLGMSWQLLPKTFFAADYQYLNVDGTGKHQFFAGIEQGIVKDFLYLYGGWAANGPTAGIGIYFKNGGLNLAYMVNSFRETERYLGRANIGIIGLYINF